VRTRLLSALSGLAALPGTELERASGLYQTAPVDSSGPDYLNAVVSIRSSLGPHELLAALLMLELTEGRERPHHNAPRTLDLDLLWYGEIDHHTSRLTLPHPRMMVRAFVLAPLRDVLDSLDDSARQALTLPSPQMLDELALQQGIKLIADLTWSSMPGFGA
jgi:2-amino-4-hydroxy-6-hydroxymethyldihydropteridine diphosphokinase